MTTTSTTFEPIPQREWMAGYRASVGAWTVEVVRAYPGKWDVFVRLDDRTVSIAEFTRRKRSLSRYYYDAREVPYQTAMRLGRAIAGGLADA